MLFLPFGGDFSICKSSEEMCIRYFYLGIRNLGLAGVQECSPGGAMGVWKEGFPRSPVTDSGFLV